MHDFEELERDQLVCVSVGNKFFEPHENLRQVHVKAQWGRARKRYGPHSTDIVVEAQRHPHVDVSRLLFSKSL